MVGQDVRVEDRCGGPVGAARGGLVAVGGAGPMGWLSSEVAAMAGPTIRAVASVALRVVAMVNLCVSFIVFLVLKVIQSQEYWPC